jgi:hypothetical protein
MTCPPASRSGAAARSEARKEGFGLDPAGNRGGGSGLALIQVFEQPRIDPVDD